MNPQVAGSAGPVGEWMQTWGPLAVNALLAIITGIYAYITYEMAKSARESATATKEAAETSKNAAESAERAANASLGANELAMSTTEVDFHLSPYYHIPPGLIWDASQESSTDSLGDASSEEARFEKLSDAGVAGFDLQVSGANVLLHGFWLREVQLVPSRDGGGVEGGGMSNGNSEGHSLMKIKVGAVSRIVRVDVKAAAKYPLSVFTHGDVVDLKFSYPNSRDFIGQRWPHELPANALGEIERCVCRVEFSFGDNTKIIERSIEWVRPPESPAGAQSPRFKLNAEPFI